MIISFKNKILSLPFIYETFTWLVGGNKYKQTLLHDYIRPQPGWFVLDIGCGTAEILHLLNNVRYTGFDYNPAYIQKAKKRYGNRGTFICEEIDLFSRNKIACFDISIALGVIHHLDNLSASKLFDLAGKVLKPGGRLITCDPVFVNGQHPLARILIKMDRGCYPRNTTQYETIATKHFNQIKTYVRNDLNNIPYTQLVMECTKDNT